MSLIGIDEDEYWENYREEYEHGLRPRSEWADMERGPEYEDKNLFLDEEGQTEEIEAEFGCRMNELSDEELSEIVERFTGEWPDDENGPRWNRKLDCIEYRIKTA